MGGGSAQLLLAMLRGGASRGHAPVCAASTGSACCLKPLLAAPSLKALPGFPSQRSPALDSLGGRDIQGLVRNGQGHEAGLHLGTRGWVTHVTGTNRRMVPTPTPTMSSDPFLDKLSRPKAQPVRTPRLGLEESQVGNPWGWLSSSPEHPQRGGWGHRGNQGAAHSAATPA